MKRNIEKMTSEGRKLIHKNYRFDLGSDEMADMYEMYNGNGNYPQVIWDVMRTAFLLGTANGYRMRKSEEKSKASVKKISA